MLYTNIILCIFVYALIDNLLLCIYVYAFLNFHQNPSMSRKLADMDCHKKGINAYK